MQKSSKGDFVWYDLLTSDVAGAIATYGAFLPWKTQPFGGPDYLMWVGGQGPLGGVMTLPPEAIAMGARPHWMGHVAVDNVEATVALTTKLGGKVYKSPFDIPGVGRSAVLGDPDGLPFGVLQAEKPMDLHDKGHEGEVCWHELMARDEGTSYKFYSELLGWTTLETMDMGPMGVYRIYGVGTTRLGGIMTLPKPGPPNPMWVFYFSTPNVEETLERAKKAGATLAMGPHTVPGGGRICQCFDGQGVPFALHQEPKK